MKGSTIGLFLLTASVLAPAPAARAAPFPRAEVREGPRLPAGRGSHAAGLIGGRVVIAGGTSWSRDRTVKTFHQDSLVYRDGAWSEGPALPVRWAEGAFGSDARRLVLAGGLSAEDRDSDAAFEIISEHGELGVRSLPSLPAPRSMAGGAVSGGVMYVAGGSVGGKESADLWSLDLGNPDAKWRRLPALPAEARDFPGLTAAGGALYLIGGMAGGTAPLGERSLSDVWRYDIGHARWSRLGQLPVRGYYWSSDPINSRQLLLAGGADGRLHDDIWVLDLQPFAARRIGQTVLPVSCAPFVRVSRNQWWMIGGEPDSNKHRSDRVSVISLR